MKRLIKDHPLKDRRVRNIETGKVMGIQDVYEMGLFDMKYIAFLTWINGSVAPEFRSHAQLDWEMTEEDEESDLSKHWKSHIEDNRKEYELVPLEEEHKYPISDA